MARAYKAVLGGGQVYPLTEKHLGSLCGLSASWRCSPWGSVLCPGREVLNTIHHHVEPWGNRGRPGEH